MRMRSAAARSANAESAVRVPSTRSSRSRVGPAARETVKRADRAADDKPSIRPPSRVNASAETGNGSPGAPTASTGWLTRTNSRPRNGLPPQDWCSRVACSLAMVRPRRCRTSAPSAPTVSGPTLMRRQRSGANTSSNGAGPGWGELVRRVASTSTRPGGIRRSANSITCAVVASSHCTSSMANMTRLWPDMAWSKDPTANPNVTTVGAGPDARNSATSSACWRGAGRIGSVSSSTASDSRAASPAYVSDCSVLPGRA